MMRLLKYLAILMAASYGTSNATVMILDSDGNMVPKTNGTVQTLNCGCRSALVSAETLAGEDTTIIVDVFYSENETRRRINFTEKVAEFVEDGHNLSDMEIVCFSNANFMGLRIPHSDNHAKTLHLILTDEGRVMDGYNLTGHAILTSSNP